MATAKKSTTNSSSEYKNKSLCPSCGKWKTNGTEKSASSFYKSTSRLYKYNDYKMLHCKDCVQEEYERCFSKTGDVYSSIKSTCLTFNIPLDSKTLDTVIKNYDIEGKSKSKSAYVSTTPFKDYMRLLNSLASNGNLGGSNYVDDFDSLEMIKTVEKVEIEAEKLSPQEKLNKMQSMAYLTEEEELTKKDCIEMLEQDPFIGSSIFDQKYLYKALIPYLDEDTLEDAFKLSQVLQIVNNNNQIRRIDLIINALSSDIKNMISNQSDIKSLTSTKKQIVDNTDKIAKENGISVKNRGDKKAGKSTLTNLMKDLRELKFEDAEADYYDELKGIGMQHASDASMKALFSQIRPDENDWSDIFRTNRELINKLYKEVDELKEENRLLHLEVSKCGGVK